ncbi:MAG: RluA family pseudouridine synthase [Proteobacteria bacterium]|nr:RluA family pseudouridine synthase [Pseudomonadota bacterium]
MEIIFQDEAIVVINKPGGLLAVPGRGPDKQDCAASRLRTLFPTMIVQPAVHRLDMYTSGLMVFAMTTEAHRFLSLSFARREVNKRYTAIVQGVPLKNGGQIRLPFRLDPANRPLQIYDATKGKLGITLWEKIGMEGTNTRIAFTPLTGRTHQLRVHAAHPLGLAAPIVGDSLYGSGREGDRMFLHATFLRLHHPNTRKPIEFYCQPPF